MAGRGTHGGCRKHWARPYPSPAAYIIWACTAYRVIGFPDSFQRQMEESVELRATERFPLNLPMTVRWTSRSGIAEAQTWSQDVSSGSKEGRKETWHLNAPARAGLIARLCQEISSRIACEAQPV